MEWYRGIKFRTRRIDQDYDADERLDALNRWVFILGELGLAPVHESGAYGNHSYRLEGDTFIITRTGMIPKKEMDRENYCRVRHDEQRECFLVEGRHEPSSECFLHSAVYRLFPDVMAIMHGHSSLLNEYAGRLALVETEREFPYGTKELAEAAVQALRRNPSFIIMKNHGFVATGANIAETAAEVLSRYGALLESLKHA